MGTMKRGGAFLALFGILALHLHLLAHVFAHGQKESSKEAPCPICVAVLGQRSLPAVAKVPAPPIPVAVAAIVVELFRSPLWTTPRTQQPRGPPQNAPAIQA